MKKVLSMIGVVGMVALLGGPVQAAAGCCSGHKGVCNGACCDGTALSEKCQAKAADKKADKKAEPAAKATDKAADKAKADEKKGDDAKKKADKAKK